MFSGYEHLNETKPELSNIYNPLEVASPSSAMKATLFIAQLYRKSWKDAAKMHQDGNCPGISSCLSGYGSWKFENQ